MDSRREFLKKASLLASVAGVFPESIGRAFAINPQAGTTYLDAEHVVILMQENRSFDHCFGTLSGVRGFGDPRALMLPDKKPVWMQTDEKGATYTPFRLNIKDTAATWMGSLPHGWTDQTDARNGGRYDKWLIAKKSGRKPFNHMPLALGYYNREDLPFYYSLADAFTVCDQNFCSSLTGTTPNRLFLWTGKIREDAASQARVRNEETNYDSEAEWMTFPERLSRAGIPWRIYQNEVSVVNEQSVGGMQGEQDAWLGNFTDNPLEWFSQYRVRFHVAYRQHLSQEAELLRAMIKAIEISLTGQKPGSAEHSALAVNLDKQIKKLDVTLQQLKDYTQENWDKLPADARDIHQKAFTTNVDSPDYRQLEVLNYDDNGTRREMKVPKGDVLFQFRKDVTEGKLPTVSWLVPPENFSDHPGAPWYGAWFLSESIDILTKNPEVWRKTIFILCYDENDGYFDHVPPFVPPLPGKPETGSVSKSIDTSMEEVKREMDLKRKSPEQARGGPVGLGYRVPLVVASPWSRGGAVNSQVFDHTSILMFLEKWLSNKTGMKIEESNISSWRRAICGDLTSVFKPYNGEKVNLPEFVKKEEFVKTIHKAQFKELPSVPQPLNEEEIAQISSGKSVLSRTPVQEKGTRPSCALPYELFASGKLSDDRKSFQFTFEARKDLFGSRAVGAPFMAYAFGKEWTTRSYAVAPGESLNDSWPLINTDSGNYHFRVDGPNGFFREFKGNVNDMVTVDIGYETGGDKALTGGIVVNVFSRLARAAVVEVTDNSYGQNNQSKEVGRGAMVSIPLNLSASSGWYDSSVRVVGTSLEFRFAGRVETGKEGVTDPAIGKET